ncbi:hypothetical protein PCK2_000971, partial [Pneumocystis canis]
NQEMRKKQYIYEKGSKIRQEWMRKSKDVIKQLEKDISNMKLELKKKIRKNKELKRQNYLENLKKNQSKKTTLMNVLEKKSIDLFEKYKNTFASLKESHHKYILTLNDVLNRLKNDVDQNSINTILANVIELLENINEDMRSEEESYDQYSNEIEKEHEELIRTIEQEYSSLFLKKLFIFDSIEQWFIEKLNKFKGYLISYKILIDNQDVDSQDMGKYSFLYNSLINDLIKDEISDESNSQIVELKEELNKKQLRMKNMKKDFNVYYAVKDELLTYKFKEYKYEFSFLNNAYQVSLADNYRIFLGSFSRFDGQNTLHYQNGDHCWNGPPRSAIIELHCGIKNKIVSVMEYQRCTYFMKILTPGACTLPFHKIQKDEL